MSWEVLAVLTASTLCADDTTTCYLSSPVLSRTHFSCVLRLIETSDLASLYTLFNPVSCPSDCLEALSCSPFIPVGSLVLHTITKGSLPSSECARLTTTVGLLDTFVVHSLIILSRNSCFKLLSSCVPSLCGCVCASRGLVSSHHQFCLFSPTYDRPKANNLKERKAPRLTIAPCSDTQTKNGCTDLRFN